MANLYNAFKEAVELYSNSNAIIDSNENIITYEKLYEDIEDFSSFCKDNSSQKKLLAICINKNKQIIVAQLASNKNNQVFLPLDVNQFNRNKVLLELSQPRWLLLENNIEHNEYAENKNLIKLKDFGSQILWESKEYKTYSENCAYIIFSSGSTGTPKGIMLKDNPMIKVVKEQAQAFNINIFTKFAWLLSPGFDASLSDIYTTLLSGGELYIPNFTMDKIKQLDIYFKKYSITHSDLSPSLLPILHKAGFAFSLTCIIFGGEVASEKIIKEIAENRKINMFNAYGPTETTICSSYSKVDKNWMATNIGSPLNGVLYKVIEGELHIGGEHLAIGYLDNKLDDKFYIENEIRWYKTGDYIKNEKNIYFYVGRIDNQFKYHGQLICAEEIENSAYQLGVDSSVCIYSELKQKIYLFYTGKQLKEQLKLNLMKTLPSYMIPHYIIPMEKLPKNANGKIDMKKLKESII